MSESMVTIINFKGDQNDIDRLLAQIHTPKGDGVYGEELFFDMEKIIPTPQEVINQTDRLSQPEFCVYLSAINPDSELKLESVEKIGRKEFSELIEAACKPFSFHRIKEEDVLLTEKNVEEIIGEWGRELSLIIECGEAICDCIKKYGAASEYTWQLKNWGCTGNTYWNKLIKKDGAPVVVVFWTKRGFPRDVISKLSEDYPEITFNLAFSNEYGNVGDGVAVLRAGYIRYYREYEEFDEELKVFHEAVIHMEYKPETGFSEVFADFFPKSFLKE